MGRVCDCSRNISCRMMVLPLLQEHGLKIAQGIQLLEPNTKTVYPFEEDIQEKDEELENKEAVIDDGDTDHETDSESSKDSTLTLHIITCYPM